MSQKVWENKMRKTVEQTGTGFGIGSLIAGIIGIAGFLMPYLAIVSSILAIVLGRVQNKRNPTGLATAGIILGIAGICINAIMLLLVIMFLALGIV